MKIKTTDIEPNPYRDFETYPIDRERVEGLKDSIKKDTFWGGIPVRPHPTKKGKYQIGCGHHRLVCFQEIGTKEIEVPVVSFSDAQMLRVMINENVQYAARPKLVNSDVEQAKKFLDGELAKADSIADLDLKVFSGLKTENEFVSLKRRGVGRGSILAYLGKPWTKRGWMVQAALATLKDSKTYLDRNAVETIPTVDQANTFRQEVKKHDIPKKTQKRIAKEIIKEQVATKRIPDLVAQYSLKPTPKSDPKPKPMLDDYANETIKLMGQVFDRLHHIKGNTKNIHLAATRNELRLTTEELIVKLKQIQKELEHEQEEKKKAIDSKVG